MASCSGPELGDVVDQDRPDAELAERIGAIGRDRKHPAGAEQVDRVRLGQGLDGASELLRAHRFAHPLEGDRCRVDEAIEQRGRMDMRALRASRRTSQPLAIIRKPLAQAGAKDLLQMGEAVIAEALGEAHQGRGLHARMFGDPGHRAERHLLRMLEREGGELLQPLRHALAAAEQKRPEAVVILGSRQPPFRTVSMTPAPSPLPRSEPGA